MRETPRRQRGINTLIGNGWLREDTEPRLPAHKLKGRSALRKCMFLEVPEELKALAPRSVTPAYLPPPPARPPVEIGPPKRRDPRRDVQLIPAVENPMKLVSRAPAEAPRWWEDPIAIGALLILAPPVGLAAVWSSPRYSSDARWALTVMTGLTMCLATAVALVALVLS